MMQTSIDDLISFSAKVSSLNNLGDMRRGFDGADYKPARDDKRLSGQMLRIWERMKDGQWRTLQGISDITGDPQASISAQLRHFRKERFGSHTVNRRHLGQGLYEYQLLVNPLGLGQ
jgi:hypothetical protein